ncbi:MAG TPA: ABC transporter permease [Candidatus Dormibacteraeota bacterium]
MSPRLTLATARRVANQLRRDPRTVALMVLLPTMLIILFRYVLNSQRAFDAVIPSLLCIFPFNIMFVVTSVATLRERTTGTLERLMTLPIGKIDLLAGYALAFGLFGVIEVGVATTVCITWLGLSVQGSAALLVLIAVLDALLGMALGLFVSAFARTEFQAVQFMPLFAFPQVLLCGLFEPRDHMIGVLSGLSDIMPLSYAVDAIKMVTSSTQVSAELVRDMGIVFGCILIALLAGAATLPRRTP